MLYHQYGIYGKSIQWKDKTNTKNYLSGYCLLTFSYSEIRLLFYRWESYQIYCVFFSVCLSQWLMFIWSPSEKPLEVMFKFFGSIIHNFWNRVLKKDNQNLAFFRNFSAKLCAKFYEGKFWPRKKKYFLKVCHPY